MRRQIASSPVHAIFALSLILGTGLGGRTYASFPAQSPFDSCSVTVSSVEGGAYRVHFHGICDNITIGATLFCLKPASATLQSAEYVSEQLEPGTNIAADWDVVLPADGAFIFDIAVVLDSVPTPTDDAIFARVTHNTVRVTLAGSALVSMTNDIGSLDAVELEGPPPGFTLETAVDSTIQSAPETAIPVHIAGRVVFQDVSRCVPVYEGVPLVKVRLDWDDDLDPTTIRCVWPVQCGVEHIGYAYTDENGAFSFDFVVSGVQNLGQIAPRLALAIPQQNDACQRVIAWSWDPVHYFPDPFTFDLVGVTDLNVDNLLVEVGPE